MPCPWDYGICNFGRPLIFHHYYTLNSLFEPCIKAEKKTFKEMMPFHYMTYVAMHAPTQELLPQRVMKFTILEDPSLVVITTIHLLCVKHDWELDENFQEIHQFFHFYSRISCLAPYTLYMLHFKFGKDWPSSY